VANLLAILASVFVRIADFTFGETTIAADEPYATRRFTLPGPGLCCINSILHTSRLALARVVKLALAQAASLTPTGQENLLALTDGEHERRIHHPRVSRDIRH
jgi:hypothetical protein